MNSNVRIVLLVFAILFFAAAAASALGHVTWNAHALAYIGLGVFAGAHLP